MLLTDATKPDQTHDYHLADIEPGALYLQDLGYFKVSSFAKIDKENAFFVSRHFNQSKLFTEKGKEFGLNQ